MALFETKNLTFSYPLSDKTALKNVDLKVEQGEFILVMGKSGSGKSTLLRLLKKEIAPVGKIGGEININCDSIGFVGQNPETSFVCDNVRSELAFVLENEKYSNDEITVRIGETASFFNLNFLLDKKIDELSGGEKASVAIASAIISDVQVLLLDEPLSNLDAKLRTQMRSQIALLHKRLETTFIYVTHDQTEAMTMADRIVVMKDGVVQQFDTPSNLYNHPCNMFVAGFIGTPQMNFIDATIITCSGELCALVDDITVPLPLRMQENENVKKYVGKPIVYGIRCEDMHINSSYALENKQNEITLKADLAEMMGSEVYIYSSINDKEIIAKVRSDTNISSGDSVKLYIDTEKVHLFDPESELLICD